MDMDIRAAAPAATAGVTAPADIGGAPLVLTEDEAARMLRLSARTMQRLRLDGDGPRFVKLTGRRSATRSATSKPGFVIGRWLLQARQLRVRGRVAPHEPGK